MQLLAPRALGIHRRPARELRRNLDHRLVDQHRHRVQVAGVGSRAPVAAPPAGSSRRRRMGRARRAACAGRTAPSARGWSACRAQVYRQLCQISSRARPGPSSLVVFSHSTSSSMMRNSRWRSFSCAFSVGKMSGCATGSSTIGANSTARPPPAAAAPTTGAAYSGARAGSTSRAPMPC